MSVRMMLKEGPSETKTLFFSEQNIKKISDIIRYRVHQKVKLTIPPVQKGPLIETMASFYTCRNSEDVNTLNRQVIQKLVPSLANAALDYIENQKELFDPEIDALPTPMTTTTVKVNRGNADVLFGDMWKFT